MRARNVRDRFEEKYVPEPNTGCWLWIDSLNGSGYGGIRCGSVYMMAHRSAFEVFRGAIPTGYDVDHRCRLRCCVNPDHLDAVPHAVNIARGDSGINNARKTHCPQGHAYAEHARIYNGRRYCRECQRERAKRRRT